MLRINVVGIESKAENDDDTGRLLKGTLGMLIWATRQQGRVVYIMPLCAMYFNMFELVALKNVPSATSPTHSRKSDIIHRMTCVDTRHAAAY